MTPDVQIDENPLSVSYFQAEVRVDSPHFDTFQFEAGRLGFMVLGSGPGPNRRQVAVIRSESRDADRLLSRVEKLREALLESGIFGPVHLWIAAVIEDSHTHPDGTTHHNKAV